MKIGSRLDMRLIKSALDIGQIKSESFAVIRITPHREGEIRPNRTVQLMNCSNPNPRLSMSLLRIFAAGFGQDAKG